MPFTVYHLDSERGLRGGERQLLYLARWLAARGHRSVVVCRAGAELEAEARRQGLETMTAPFLGEWDPVTAWRLARRGGPGVVLHAHTGHAAAAASLAARFGGPAWVAHRRVDFRLKGPCSARLKYGSAAAVVAVSEAIKGVLASDGVEPARVAVVHDALPLGPEEARLCGLDAPWGPAADRAAAKRAVAAAADLDPGHLWVGNLAALVPHKDQANLLRAAALVVREEPRARFLVLGDGPLRAELAGLAGSLGIAGAVRLPGRQADPRPWLRALDLYCQSSWGEGMGSVLLEAMACRVPVVATTAGGIPEVATPETARLVPPRDPAALARALVEALRDRADSERRAAAAERSLARFSVEAMGRAVVGVYEAALGARA